jgi:hypothetical protein
MPATGSPSASWKHLEAAGFEIDEAGEALRRKAARAATPDPWRAGGLLLLPLQLGLDPHQAAGRGTEDDDGGPFLQASADREHDMPESSAMSIRGQRAGGDGAGKRQKLV